VTKVGQFDRGHSKVSGGVRHHGKFSLTIYSSGAKNNESSPETEKRR